uniref:Zinc finger protein 41 n=1 Tax=Jaculus jaculus TaxID=51337 RepID=A0A8C5L8D9_JACJA
MEKKGRGGRYAKGHPQRRESSLSPEDEAHLSDAFDTSFKDDFEGVSVFVPFQRKRPYECSECEWIFKHKTDHIHCQNFRHSLDVTKHQRIHTGEKLFKCLECGKAFNCSSTLLKYQKTYTGEKSYGCEECGKAFAYSSCLIWHWKCHPQEKH